MLPLALHPGDSKGKGQQMNVTCTVAHRDHSNGFVSVTCCICTDNMWPTGISPDSGPRIVEWKQRITYKVS